MTMTPDDVPAELVEIGVAAWRKSGRYFMAPCTRAILAAVLPDHERMVRERIAAEFRARAQTLIAMRDGVEDPVLDVTGSPISTDEIYRRLADEISPEGDLR